MRSVPIGQRLRRSLLLLSLLFAAVEGVQSLLDARYVAARARAVVAAAHAVTPREKVVALRDYIRTHVTKDGYPQQGRPFLRATAGEILRSGKGWCGEASRLFICMAAAVGVPAQRINLYGRLKHTVAEAQIGPHERVVVDCFSQPIIRELEPLDQIILRRPEYDDYFTLNLRRLQIQWLVTRVKLNMGPLTYWTEQPHMLKGTLWLLLAAGLLGAHAARRALRAFLLKRGWMHVSMLPQPVPARGLKPSGRPARHSGSTQPQDVDLTPVG